MAKLRHEVENIRKTLSSSSSASFGIDSFFNGLDFNGSINKLRFELLCRKHFDQMGRLLEQVVAKAEVDFLEVDQVILAGGLAHTPKLASRVSQLFSDRTNVSAPSIIPTGINPSELAARGAALQASIMPTTDKKEIEQTIHPVITSTPHLTRAIGVLSPKNMLQIVVPSQSPLPARRAVILNNLDNEKDTVLRICECFTEIETESIIRASQDGREKESDEEEENAVEEIRKAVQKTSNILAECFMKDLDTASKVEVMIDIDINLTINISLRQIGRPGGLRGEVQGT